MGTCASVPAASAPSPEQRLAHAVPNNAKRVAIHSKATAATTEPSDCTPNMPTAVCTGTPAAAAQDHSRDSSRPATPKSTPAASAARYWRCDKGHFWPEKVNYSSQCPKGHTLSACSSMPFCHVCGGSTSVCMSCTEGCNYGVCSVCLTAVQVLDVSPIIPAANHELCWLGVSPAFLQEFKMKWADVTRGCTTGQVFRDLVF